MAWLYRVQQHLPIVRHVLECSRNEDFTRLSQSSRGARAAAYFEADADADALVAVIAGVA
jgi:hypothetical protein